MLFTKTIPLNKKRFKRMFTLKNYNFFVFYTNNLLKTYQSLCQIRNTLFLSDKHDKNFKQYISYSKTGFNRISKDY